MKIIALVAALLALAACGSVPPDEEPTKGGWLQVTDPVTGREFRCYNASWCYEP